jgi:hypothetical protein
MNNLILPCNCAGGKKYCGAITLLKYEGEDKDCEIGIKNISTKKINWVYLNKKSIKKIIKFLNYVIK